MDNDFAADLDNTDYGDPYVEWNEYNDSLDEPEHEPKICIVCGGPNEPNEWNEPCYSCMNPEIPSEKWYHDGPGDEPGWQDSTWPNER